MDKTDMWKLRERMLVLAVQGGEKGEEVPITISRANAFAGFVINPDWSPPWTTLTPSSLSLAPWREPLALYAETS